MIGPAPGNETPVSERKKGKLLDKWHMPLY